MIPDNKFVPASELAIREFNTLRGKLCAVIESMNLPHSQERAAVGLVKQHTYDSQETISQLLAQTKPGAKQKFRYNNTKVEEQ